MPSPAINIRVEPEMLARIDAAVKRSGGTRTSWFHALIEAGLERPVAMPKPPRRTGRTTADAKAARTSMCIHRMQPGAFCKRCDS